MYIFFFILLYNYQKCYYWVARFSRVRHVENLKNLKKKTLQQNINYIIQILNIH